MGWGQKTGKGQARATQGPFQCLVKGTHGSLPAEIGKQKSFNASGKQQNLGVKYECSHLHLNSLGFLACVTRRIKQCSVIANITCSESKYHCHQC